MVVVVVVVYVGSLFENFISIIIFLVQPLVGFCGENLLHTFSILN